MTDQSSAIITHCFLRTAIRSQEVERGLHDQEDRACTARLQQAGRLLGIRILDHVVIGESECFSFANSGLLTEAEAGSRVSLARENPLAHPLLEYDPGMIARPFRPSVNSYK